jgi:hypothetical protein
MRRSVELMTEPCLYCLRTGFEPSAEHVMPAGLGRHADVVLPRGAVCGPCNNHLGRQVDEALVHLMHVQFIRALHGVADRNGKRITELAIGNGTLRFSAESGIELLVHDDEHLTWKDAQTLSVELVSTRRKSGDQWRRATRAILKLGLALAYLAKGSGYALSSVWNPARDAIYGAPYSGYLLVGPFDVFKSPDLVAQLLFDVPGAAVVARLQFGGLELLADLMLGSASEATRAWASDNGFQVVDIEPRSGDRSRRPQLSPA